MAKIERVNMKPMLASGLDEEIVKAHLLQGPLFMSAKLDGIRALATGTELLSRSLKPIPCKAVVDLFKEYKDYDGELIYGEPNGENVYNETFSGVMTIEGTGENVRFFVFDHVAVPADEYIQRMSRIQAHTDKRVYMVPQKLVKTFDEVLELEEQLLQQGFEGAMLRRPKAPYKFGRATAKSLDLMKVKREEDTEGLILSVYEAMQNNNEAFTNELGQTDRSSHAENKEGKGMCGGFVLKLADGTVTKVSAGRFNHKERIVIWNHRDILVSKSTFIKFRHFPYGRIEKPRQGRALGFRDPIDM